MDHLPLENLGNDIRVEQVTSTPRDALNRELARSDAFLVAQIACYFSAAVRAHTSCIS